MSECRTSTHNVDKHTGTFVGRGLAIKLSLIGTNMLAAIKSGQTNDR